MLELILDYSTWRCGGTVGNNVLGKGGTALLNAEGYMCCLGQFSKQLNPSITDSQILDLGEPSNLDEEIHLLSLKDIDVDDDGKELNYTLNTSLSDEAMAINDDPSTTPEEKIKALKELFAKHECQITVINKPNDTIQKES